MEQKLRMSVEITQTVKDRMEVIQARTGATSLSEVIRRSLAVYDELTENQSRGGHMEVHPHHDKGEPYRLKLTW